MVSKKLEEKQRRREAEERREQERRRASLRRNLVTLTIALLVGALVVFLILSERRGAEDVGVAAGEAGCTDIQTQEDLGRDHVEEGTPVQYNSQPPTSGSHYANWADPGFHEEPVHESRLVHNLEHGQIVFWYRPDASEETIADLRQLVSSDRLALIAAPYDGLTGGHEFAMTAWTASQGCENVSSEVVNDFRRRYQGRGPEPAGIPVFRD